MNENKHTPEPWATKQSRLYGNETMLVDKDDHYIASIRANSDLSDGDSQDIARRITACVNACAGFSTETLELIASVGGMQHKMTATAAVASQRDELLAALDVALENLRPHGDNCFVSDHYEGDPGAGCNCGIDGVTDYLISTIARVKGEQ